MEIFGISKFSDDGSIIMNNSVAGLGDTGRKPQQQQQQQHPEPIPRSKDTNEREGDAESETSAAGCAAISRTSSAAALMETDFPALEVRQLDEEPVRRRRQQLIMDEGGDRVYQG